MIWDMEVVGVGGGYVGEKVLVKSILGIFIGKMLDDRVR